MPFSIIAFHWMIRFFAIFALFFCFCLRNPASPAHVSLHVSKSGNGQLNVSFADTIVDLGSKMTLKAVPDAQMMFLGWYGSLQSTQDSITFIVSGDMTVEARFRPAFREPELVEIPSKNKTFIMGSNAAVATFDEKPAHPVRLTYTYFIDKYEITQYQYRRLMGVNPVENCTWDRTAAVGDSFPVGCVTWYEAVLFCNARSKASGLDTVYEFTAVCRETQECPYVLENLVIHYDRFGFRLPTEAEWEYACRAGAQTDYFWGADYPDTGGAVEYAWFSDNASRGDSLTARPTGLKKPNGFGLFDMTGNAAEWVNDWLAVYPDTLSVDPVGPVYKGNTGNEDTLQRPLRGGAFNLGKDLLRSSCRKGEYETHARLSGPSIGFRCALGTLFPSASGPSRVRADTSGIQSCNLSGPIDFMGISGIKCVFVKEEMRGKRKLCYIDFSEPEKPVHELPDSTQPHSPTISPDGDYVAYSSQGDGGTSGASQVTIRAFRNPERIVRSSLGAPAFTPRWWVDQNNLDTFVVFTSNTIDNSKAEWKKSKTFRQKVVGGTFVDQPKIICDSGSFHGGLSYDGDFLATGYPNAHVLNLSSNDLYNYFAAGKNGSSLPIQVCNVSINPGFERQDEIMFLDYGSPMSSIIGRKYGIHEFIFTVNSVDSICWYGVPSGYTKWDDAEWSNHCNYAVAVAKSIENAENSSVYCIDLKTHNNLKIIEGKNIREPFLWIDPLKLPQKSDPYYNFAKYNIPGKLSQGQMPLCMKLKLFWSQFVDLQCVAVGGSPMYFGLDPAFLKTVSTLNMATIASDPLTSYTIASVYALSLIPNLKVVVMGLDAYALRFDRDNPYLNGLPRTLGYRFDSENQFWKAGLPSEIKAKIAAFDTTHWPLYNFNGFPKDSVTGQGWRDTLIDTSMDYQFSDSIIQSNILVYRELSEMLAVQKKHLLIINFPENPNYKRTNFIGCYGPNRTAFNHVCAWLRNLESRNPYIHFYDANRDGDHDYTDKEARDRIHLNCLGAKKLSVRLDSLISIYVKK
jgi:formylglycine-generating enzyme required for sulfatase activity